MTKHSLSLRFVLTVGVLLALASVCVAQNLPSCNLGCFSVTCNVTPQDTNGNRYCLKWSQTQSGQGYAYNADPNSSAEVFKNQNGVGSRSHPGDSGKSGVS